MCACWPTLGWCLNVVWGEDAGRTALPQAAAQVLRLLSHDPESRDYAATGAPVGGRAPLPEAELAMLLVHAVALAARRVVVKRTRSAPQGSAVATGDSAAQTLISRLPSRVTRGSAASFQVYDVASASREAVDACRTWVAAQQS